MTISKMYGTAVLENEKKRLNAAGIIVPPVPRKDFWTDPNHFNLEEDPLEHFPGAELEKLLRMGHDIVVPPENYFFGRGQIIWRDDDGTLCGATEPRSDGTVAVW